MTPIEIIRRKKNPQADSCLPPADRLPSLVEPSAEPSAAPPRQTAQDAITGPIAPLAELDIKNVAPCPLCGCPAAWLSKRPPHKLRCGQCQPPPFAALVHCWLMCVLVPISPFGGGNEWRWEPFKPRFSEGRVKKQSPPT